MKYSHPFENEILVNERSKYLILGTFPSQKSKEFGFFYGNKQNAFWKILGDIFSQEFQEKDILLDTEKENCKALRQEFCQKNGIVLYDIVQSYEGDHWCSTDRDLFKQKNIQYSIDQIYKILIACPNLLIFGTSHRVVSRYRGQVLGYAYKIEHINEKQKFLREYNQKREIIYLPSPSPLNRKQYSKKVEEWKKYLNFEEQINARVLKQYFQSVE